MSSLAVACQLLARRSRGWADARSMGTDLTAASSLDWEGDPRTEESRASSRLEQRREGSNLSPTEDEGAGGEGWPPRLAQGQLGASDSVTLCEGVLKPCAGAGESQASWMVAMICARTHAGPSNCCRPGGMVSGCTGCTTREQVCDVSMPGGCRD